MHEQNINKASEIILSKIKTPMPKLAIMLGSGLGNLADNLEESVTIPYKDLAGFPQLTVRGHDGSIVIGLFNGTPLLCLKGRVHSYETDDFMPLKTLIRTLKKLGIDTLMTTSSSGSLNKDMPTGSIMAINDHINFMGINPLLGHNEDNFGPRFPSMNDAWGKDTRKILHKSAQDAEINLYDGVYFAFRGPCFETPAEIRMAKTLGGDAVGMSAVPECIIANHCGLNVIGCAIISNMAEGMNDEILSHEQTLSGAKKAEENLLKLVESFVPNFYKHSQQVA